MSSTSKEKEDIKEVFDRHFARCLFKTGDKVRFKKPRRNPIYGVIEHIETDIDKMHWVEGGVVPRYIKICVPQTNKQTGEIKSTSVWTTESKLVFGG